VTSDGKSLNPDWSRASSKAWKVYLPFVIRQAG
jgi:hypothetical protein